MALSVGTNSYISVNDADTYFDDAIHGTTWEDADPTDKSKALVTAYRMLDRVRWAGDRTVSSQAQDWPRTGIVDPEGNAVASDSVPQFVIDAQSELALSLLSDATVQTNEDTGSNIRTLKAGSAEIEFFVPQSGPRFPTIVHELIGYYIEGGSFSNVPFIDGAGEESSIGNFGLSEGY